MTDKERDAKLIEITTEIVFFNKHIPQLLHDVSDLSIKVSSNDAVTNKAVEDVKYLTEKIQLFIEKNGEYNAKLQAIEKEREAEKKELDDLWETVNSFRESIAELKTYHKQEHHVTPIVANVQPQAEKSQKSWIDKLKDIQFVASFGAIIIAFLWILFKIYSWLATQIPGLPGA